VTELAHATLQRLAYAKRRSKDKPALVGVDGEAFAVQFNPATLKISRKNNVDRGGVTAGTQKRQQPSTEGSALSFELEFDTSEQGAGESRVNVREWTALVRQFVEPDRDKPGRPPPAVRFSWGTLVFNGIIDQVTEDLDHFAPDGTPLRAKLGVSIAEQDFRYENNQDGGGARTAKDAPEPGAAPAGTAPGSAGTDNPEQVVVAQDGESAQQLLARVGLDPEAWRGAMTGVEDPLSLAPGTPVQLGPEVSTGGVVGLAAGFAAAPTRTSPEALVAALGGPAGTAGFALAAAGGIAAADAALQRAAVDAAAARATAGFDVPAFVASAAPLDPRSAGYGRDVPLQVRADANTLAEVSAAGRRSIAARARRAEAPPPSGPVPPWERPT
jgi:hypothetical protein